MERLRSTTVLCVRGPAAVAMGGDGQVTLGSMIVKAGASKIRRLHNDRVLAGFAGGAADAFTLLDLFEGKLDRNQGHLERAAIELAREWRTNKMLRPLEAMLCVADKEKTLIVSGNGDVIEPEHGIAAIGSGSGYAAAAARALAEQDRNDPRHIAERALRIAAEICIYTNSEICVEVLPKPKARIRRR